MNKNAKQKPKSSNTGLKEQLATKTFQLKIEAALEKVRARTMAMHKSDELSAVASVLFHQLQKLDIPALRRCLVGIVDESKGTLQSWYTSMHGDSSPKIITYPLKGHRFIELKTKGWRKQKPFSIELKGTELKVFVRFAEQHGFERNKGEKAPTYMIQNHAPFRHGYLEAATHEPISDEDFQIFQRFAKVFEQSYTRFLDLQKAEAQTREAQIEVALERIRARSMAMHNSNELWDVINVVFTEFGKLDIKIDSCWINIYKKDDEGLNTYIAAGGQTYQGLVYQPYINNPLFNLIKDGKKNPGTTASKTFERKITLPYWKHLFAKGVNIQVSKKRQEYILSTDGLTSVFSFGKYSSMGVHRYSKKPFFEEDKNIVKRFCLTFDQIYTRFLDLQKAEAQAREAEIQLALERVRARTMAMQKSEELPETAGVLFQQFSGLGQELLQVTIGIIREDKGVTEFSVTDWSGSGAGVNRTFNLSNDEPTLISKMYAGWKQQKKSILVDLSGKELKDWLTYRNTVSGTIIRSKDSGGRRVIASAFFSKGHLSFSSPTPPSTENIHLLERFAGVFEQTYTRFLDLQKAEAQVRESMIEAALERIRSRSLAMHHSHELKEVIAITFEKLNELKVVHGTVGIQLFEQETKSAVLWVGNNIQDPQMINMPYDKKMMLADTYVKDGWEAKKDGVDIINKEYSSAQKNKFFNYIFSNNDLTQIPESARKVLRQMQSHIICLFTEKNSALFVDSFRGEYFSHDELNVFKRTARVFEQAYVRFLDLQKAEAQAKEAEIQLALERVRARTMAMHKSEELQDVASLLYKEFQGLGVTPFLNCGYVEIDEENKIQYAWMTSPDGTLMDKFQLPLSGEPTFQARYDAWKNQVPVFHQVIGGSDLVKHIELASRHFGSEEVEKMVKSRFPDPTIFYCGNFSKGYLHLVSGNLLTSDEESLLERFTRAFEMTYKRFLDLQKAEAQVREAKIEAALEKVRSRSLAMHKTEELGEVATVVFEKLRELDLPVSDGVAIVTHIEGSKDQVEWMENPGMPSAMKFFQPYYEHPILADYWKAKNEGLDFIAPKYTAKQSRSFFKHIFKHTDYKHIPQEIKDYCLAAETYSYFAAFQKNSSIFINDYSGRTLNEQEIDIVKRFSKVFEQAYVRFLDLQKSEAQARESQIQLALERVRARTMAMQKSDELAETAAVLFQQFNVLGNTPERMNIGIVKDQQGHIEFWSTEQGGKQIGHVFNSGIEEPTTIAKLYKAWKGKKRSLVIDLSGQKLSDWINYLRKDLGMPFKDELISEHRYHTAAFFSQGTIMMSTPKPLPAETISLLERFASVFDQTYTRFLDLQKAEKQAREAEVQLALERVRARTMAMQKSEELSETALLMHQQFGSLTKLPEKVRMVISILREEERIFDLYITTTDGTQLNTKYSYSIDEPYVFQPAYQAVKNKKPSFIIELSGQSLKEYLAYMERLSYPVTFREQVVITSATFSKGYFCLVTSDPVSNETLQLLERFAKVFEQTYTRFLDLQKVETQARESQIEAALERVRSRSIAMRKSDEIADIAGKIFSELRQLDLVLNRVLIWTFNDIEKYTTWWSANPEVESTADSYRIDYNENPVFINYLQAWQQRKPIHLFTLSGDTKKTWEDHLFENTEMSRLPMVVRKGMREEGTLYTVSVISDYGLMMSGSFEPLSEANIDIIQRFGRVFQQSYTRYLDVQKAEEQAREAQIEASLERVRSKAMAMHNSNDLPSTAIIAFTELKKLGFIPIRCGISLQNKENRKNLLYAAISNPDGDNLSLVGWAILDDHPVLAEVYDRWMLGEDYFPRMKGELMISYYEKIKNTFKIPLKYSADQEQFGYFMYFTHGVFYGWCDEPITDGDKRILKRFAGVVDLTFKRYFDLQKAEAQAREAQIEAALEKVRGKAMAMHESSELTATASLVFTELRILGVNSIRCGVGVIDRETKNTQLYSATSSEHGDTLGLIGQVNLSMHPIMHGFYNSFVQQEEYFPELTGKEIQNYYETLSKGLSVSIPAVREDQKEYGISIPLSIGSMYAWSDTPYGEDQLKIIRRFASIIDLTFRRYFELQQSEANAKEAIKQAALDRIRADIASMRTVDDLDRITPLIWNELTILGIPFIRCGVFIMDESQNLVHTFLSTPDGKAIAAFHLPYETPGNLRKAIESWHNKEKYIDHWNDEEFLQFADILVSQGALESAELYLKTIPQGGFYLHFLPFLQGMLYVGNMELLDEEAIELIQSVADAFSTAYARYEDFNKLEAAKKQVDSALNELQAAQKQLVQSEKMASLGELTAGIAHEIQNPLNFVNNFSDVSNELLEEIKAELDKGNVEEATAMIEDVKQNLEKILHHGKRADGIVKGMLQHSRTSSGQKELSDINSLASEYLNLAYHGMRAKDKSFNTKFESQLDSSIERINIVPQEIGRVILNLINNAFYAVSEKQKLKADGYQPLVILATQKLNDKIEISVKDNGGGISDAIKEKIFQPFFTTKPTGQGTGLGLSLAYDIVRAHGGEIKVESKQNEGTTFIINLPVNQ